MRKISRFLSVDDAWEYLKTGDGDGPSEELVCAIALLKKDVDSEYADSKRFWWVANSMGYLRLWTAVTYHVVKMLLTGNH